MASTKLRTSGTDTKSSAKGMLTPNELSTFCVQVSMILRAGIPLSEGMAMMSEDTKSAQGRQILEGIRDKAELGEPLWAALGSAGVFPKYVVDMVQVGEATGKLDNVMDSLCAYYEREEALGKSIRNAVTYPLVMIVMMVAVITVLIVKVMPIFQQVFRGLGSEMTGFSLGVMRFGTLLSRYSAAIVGVAAALLAAYFILRATAGGRAMLDRWKHGFFATRKLYSKIASGRFASAMSLMLSSGLDTDRSLDMVYRLVDNEGVRSKIGACKESLRAGLSFSEALVQADIFGGIYARMIAVGFRTGSVDMVMERLARRYEEEIDEQIGSLISILEPTLVAVLSVIVGMILLSVMLPLMGIMSSIG